MSDTYKVYTSYPTTPSRQQPYFIEDNNYPTLAWGWWFFLLVAGLILTLWVGVRMLEWWDSWAVPYSATPRDTKYYNYNTNTTKDTTVLAKPKANKWAQNSVFKAKPVVPPRMFVAGRMNGVEFSIEGDPQAKYLTTYDRNQYFAQKGVSVCKQDKIEAKWEKDLFNGV